MNGTEHDMIMQRWKVIQGELLPELREELGGLTPRLEKLIHVLDWVRIEEYVRGSWCSVGRPPHERWAMANAFVAKAVLKLGTTRDLIERLTMDRSLRRICGFPMYKKLPDETIFSRVFAEFTKKRLAERVHEALIKTYLGDKLIGHINRDGTAIEAREKIKYREVEAPKAMEAPRKRGRPKKGEERAVPEPTRIERQLGQTLEQMLAELPKECDKGTKSNAQGYTNSWKGYKLHVDTADCGVPISVVLTSASTHDSQAAIPLALMTASRVTNCYDVMDAGYCSEAIRSHSRSLEHVPLIDHNPRGGEKKAFAPHEAQRYKERSQAERTNARIKDEFGGRNIWVRGGEKVMSHLMFGILALSADALMRLFT